MFCPRCDRRVENTHRFCGGCGQSLAGITDAAGTVETDDGGVGGAVVGDDVVDRAAGEMEAPDAASVPAPIPPPVDVPSSVDSTDGTEATGNVSTDLTDATGAAPMDDAEPVGNVSTERTDATRDISTDRIAVTGAGPMDEAERVGDVSTERTDATRNISTDRTDVTGEIPTTPTLPDLGDRPTRPIEIRRELPDPQWAPTETIATHDGVNDDEMVPAGRVGADESFGSTTGVNVIQSDPPPTPRATDAVPAPNTQITRTAEMPEFDVHPPLFDGATDVRELPLGREPFKLKLVFVLAFFGGIAALMAAAATVIDLRTSIPVDGIATGPRLLDDLGTNLAIAGFVGVAVMVVGALLSCFGFRWGGGLAGGAGLAVAGWAAVTIGLAELPVSAAEATTRASPIPFTLKVTRDLGFWLVLVAGAIGVLVFVASLRSIRSGGHPPHNPWVAAVGAVAGVVLVAGPLLPVGRDATFSNNFRSTSTALDLPTAYFAGRLIQLGLILFSVVVGLLIVRAYGLGVAAGGISVAAWMWISSLLEIDAQPPGPIGIAGRNFGTADTSPHAVTTVGVVLTIAMLLVAAVLSGAGHLRHRHRRS